MRNRKAFTTVLLFCTGFIASHPLVVSAADKGYGCSINTSTANYKRYCC